MEPNQQERWSSWAATDVPVDSRWHMRPLTDLDIPAVAHSVDAHVSRGLLMDQPFGGDEAARLVQRTAVELPAAGRGAIWAIAEVTAESPQTSAMRGVITLRAVEDNRAQVGFWLAAQARGRGVAAACVRALTQATVAPDALAGFMWESPVGNIESLRVARAAGFRPVGTRTTTRHESGPAERMWWAELNAVPEVPDRRWAECLVEIAAGAWQLQPMDRYTAPMAEEFLPVSACVPTGVWAAREITTARVDAVVALLHRGDRAWVLASSAEPTEVAQEASVGAAGVVSRYARRALGLITP